MRKVLWAAGIVALMVFGAATALFIEGRVPVMSTPSLAYEPQALFEALRAVDSNGQVDLAQLKAQHEAIDRYVASLQGAFPERFSTVDERVAFWLNASHGLVLHSLLDARDGLATSLPRWRTYSIGGEYVHRAAIERRVLPQVGDPRVWLALFTGARGRGVLDGAPFDSATLDAQLDDAARRFMRQRNNVSVDGSVLKVSSLLHEHEAEFLAALPADRRHVLQVVWAYLPDSCTQPCLTRSELDHACGPKLDRCTVVWTPVDERLTVTH